MTLFICTTCTSDSEAFIKQARAALPTLDIAGVACMSGCARAQTVAFRETGKTAYLFGDITPADFHELESFAALYAASTDGTFADARVLGGLRLKAIARIPA